MKSDVSLTFSQKSSAGCYPHHKKPVRNTVPYFCNIHYTLLLPSNAQLLKLISSHQVIRLLNVFSYHEDATSFQVPHLTSKNFYIRSFRSYMNITERVTFECFRRSRSSTTRSSSGRLRSSALYHPAWRKSLSPGGLQSL